MAKLRQTKSLGQEHSGCHFCLAWSTLTFALVTMRFHTQSLLQSLALALLVPALNALAPSDSYRDADVGQNGYLGGDHNMDPAVVDSAQFGQLWKIPFNAKEQVRSPKTASRVSVSQLAGCIPLSCAPWWRICILPLVTQ